jgi:hypothetical protein
MRALQKLLVFTTILLSSAAIACSGDDGSGTGDGGGGGVDGGGGGGVDGGGGGGVDGGGGGGLDGGGTTLGACANGLDDDGDGLADGMDPECTGPLDDDEGSFATGIPGDNRDPMWQDCFFDGNSGAGDDMCRYRTECLTGELPTDDPDCEISMMCLEFCADRTPNGCDCFGCCDVTLEDGSTTTVLIGAGCSLATIEECDTCVKDDECLNECGTCELCPGRTAEDLPPECYDTPDGGTPMYVCEDGTTCMTDADCPMGDYCSLGCCLGGLI